jgi:hypothetical protein
MEQGAETERTITTEQIRESFAPHTHADDERFTEMPHIHAMGADWSVTLSVPMGMHYGEKLDVIEAMEFRRLVVSMMNNVEAQAQATPLEEMPTANQQFAIIAFNADMALAYALLNVVDQALEQQGVNPPCHLQPVESSTIRSFGFVQVQAPGEEVPETGFLFVAFHGNSLYRYDDVEAAVVKAFIEAESKGKFFAAAIKNNYAFSKVV